MPTKVYRKFFDIVCVYDYTPLPSSSFAESKPGTPSKLSSKKKTNIICDQGSLLWPLTPQYVQKILKKKTAHNLHNGFRQPQTKIRHLSFHVSPGKIGIALGIGLILKTAQTNA